MGRLPYVSMRWDYTVMKELTDTSLHLSKCGIWIGVYKDGCNRTLPLHGFEFSFFNARSQVSMEGSILP